MSSAPSTLDIASALQDRRLLLHPFYRRWEAGDVSMDELGAYAAQYRHFEAYLPQFLGRLRDTLPEGRARDLVAANLADELGDPVPHLELFDGFAAAVGSQAEAPSSAMSALLAIYDELLDTTPTAALAGLVAYESQAAEVAASKAGGLRRHHGLDEDGVRFWAHHAAVDADHGRWLTSALEEQPGDPVRTLAAARRTADAWWAFLDEREAAA
jgi:pyrroloquinoline-quinone synthase